MPEEQGIWLYAVTRRLDSAVLNGLSGVSAEQPRVIERAGLAAVVGDVPLTSFGEEALHRNFEDLDWLGAVAWAHDAVIGAVVANGPAVPVRLATVYRDDDRVREVLQDRAAEFSRTLERLTGRIEWGVKVFLEAVPEAAPVDAGLSGQGTGAAYLARRRAAMTAQERHERRAVEQTDRVHSELATFAVDARTHPPQSRALADDEARMLLNAAYLVDDNGARSFTEAVAACDQDNDAIRVQLTGPWPPYSFSALEEQ